MNNFLAKLKPDTKVNVGVSVSPNVGLEMIMVDPAQRKVIKYAQRPLAYNQSTREIEDYSEFKTALTELFKELKITPQEANVVLNMPNVHFGHSFLPTTLDDESVTGALVSKAEETYLFKKNAPSVSWVEVKENNSTEKRYILYAAIQESVVEVIQQIFAEVGATLIAIENTYSSLMKTLEFTELTKDYAKNPGSWNILLVSQNSYAVFSLIDYNIIEYYEDPLAIKSFSQDEVYVAIAQAASAVLDRFPTDKLLILSESNDVSAEILALQLKQPGSVMFLECNQYAKQPIMDVDFNVLPNYVKFITPEAVGAAIYKAKDFSLKMNFINKNDIKAPETISFMGMNVTKEQLILYTAIISIVIIAISFIAQMAVGAYSSTLENQKSQLEQEATAQAAELAELQKSKGKIDIYSAAKTIDKSMIDKVRYYNAIGADIPAKVWLTSFYADTNNAYAIKGETLSVDDVHLFFRNIKSQVPNSDLNLSKLSVDDEGGLIDIDKTPNAHYTFELTNSSYASVMAAPVAPAEGAAPEGAEAPPEPEAAPSGFKLPKLPGM